MLVWGPFLVLGPVLASEGPGGPGAWGTILAGYGAGSVAGGLLALGRRPRRPLAASVAASQGRSSSSRSPRRSWGGSAQFSRWPPSLSAQPGSCWRDRQRP